MSINILNLIYFSPTGTTRTILESIAKGVDPAITECTDLCKTDTELDFEKNTPDLAIIGMPTYASRIPPEASSLLAKLRGKGVPVALVAVYGNNKFGDVLLELKDIACSCGFVPVAAAAFIGEHSFSTKDKPIAAGRPDARDLVDAEQFGARLKAKIFNNATKTTPEDLKVPGNFPYREWNKIPAQPPVSNVEICTKCGKCKSVCPVSAINISQEVNTNADLCIFCCACVKACPVSARKMTDETLLNIQEKLFKSCSDRKQPEMFL